MSDWDEYLAATRRLYAVREEAAAVVADRAAAAQAARRELAALHGRLALQRARLASLATGAGQAVPPLVVAPDAGPGVPGSGEVRGEAGPHAGVVGGGVAADSPEIATEALRRAGADLDAAEEVLAAAESGTGGRWPLAGWAVVPRNLVVYGLCTLPVLILSVVLLISAGGTAGGLSVLLVGVLAPAVTFGTAWLLVGLLFGGDGEVDRTPGWGAAVSLTPTVLLLIGLALLALST